MSEVPRKSFTQELFIHSKNVMREYSCASMQAADLKSLSCLFLRRIQ